MNRIAENGGGFNDFHTFSDFEGLALSIIEGEAAAGSFTKWREVEEFCHRLALAFGRMVMALILKRLDTKLLEARDKKACRAAGFRETSIKTTLGEVSLRRRYYKEQSGGYVFLLDKVLGMDTVGKMTMPLVERVAETAAECSYRETAAAIRAATGQSLSHGGAWNAMQALGSKLAEMDAANGNAAMNGQSKGQREIRVLQEEFDGVWVNMQGKDRPKRGRKAELKLAIAYEGAEFSGRDKHGKETWDLVNPLYMSGFEKPKEFYEKKEGQIGAFYNLDEIEKRLINGDGGGWIKGFAARAAEEGEAYFQLDQFHVKREILANAPSKNVRRELERLLGERKIQEMLERVERLADEVDDGAKKGVERMLAYFRSNSDALIPIKERGLALPDPPAGTAWGNMGAMEGSVCNLVAVRMKKRKASFTKSGGGNLARIICLKRGGALGETLERMGRMALPMAFREVVAEVLSAAKAPLKDGKGYEYFANCGRPFEGAAATNGRKAVRRLCEYSVL